MEHTEWLTVIDVATELKVHTRTVKRWIKAGALSAVQVAPKSPYKIDRRWLDRFLASRSNQPDVSGERCPACGAMMEKLGELTHLGIYTREDWLCPTCGNELTKQTSYRNPHLPATPGAIPLSKT